ncbi:GH92 family glycosyl hydrolase [Granulicella cerasi]|uniref:GH92 family glycosyl hydrolase n=1 Tax=Granulicella cerasi TaxID=741063 RepID=A0ABW1Z5M0_9BACT|nr:GH92 family glycosyl hydrolase [Granulicella cerasi]
MFGMALGCCGAMAARAQNSRWVDPYIGSEGGGHVFVGAAVPFGMVKAGPDVGDNTGNGGWLPEGKINGFSQTHVTGTGGGAKYGNVLIQPTVGRVSAQDAGSLRSGEHVEAGLYRVRLDRYATQVAVTTSSRAALYELQFPRGGEHGLLIDAGHCLSSYPNQNEDQRTVASTVRVVSDHEIEGSTSVAGGWNFQKKPYRVFFSVLTDTAIATQSGWHDEQHDLPLKVGDALQGVKSGVWLGFGAKSAALVHVKVGISFLSEQQARANAEQEIVGFDFAAALAKARHAWDAALDTIEVEGIDDTHRRIFYTAMYHMMLMPTDRTGENPAWHSSEPYYDDFYAIWDTFRTSGPLLTLIAQDRQAGMVRALIDIYRHEGWLPDARSGNSNGRTQGGSNAEFEITDAYVKGLPGINWEDAFKAVQHDAEATPDDQRMEGRGGIEDWKSKGYLTLEGVDRPGSKQMEYAADDYEVALLARGLGKQAEYAKYLQRSRNWERLWNDAYEEDGVRGFIWPRHKDGSWRAKFNGAEGCSWGGETFYEGNSWTYSTFVPQDNARLVAKAGGGDAFAHRLDLFLSNKDRYDVGNEPGFMAPYLYLWTRHAAETADHLRAILAASYNASRSGIPGNDDSGAMSSWYLFGVMGFYPNAGQDVYLIGSPSVPRTVLHLAQGKSFVIEAKGVSEENKYVDHAELNGKPLDRAWFRHGEIARGGTLVLHMTAKPSAWPTGAFPPSASDGVQEVAEGK